MIPMTKPIRVINKIRSTSFSTSFILNQSIGGKWSEVIHQDKQIPVTSRDLMNALASHSSPPVVLPKVQTIESPFPFDSAQHSPTQSVNSSLCNSPPAPLSHEEIFHNLYNSGSDSDPEIDSLNMGEHVDGEDEESVVTVNAAHDQGYPSRSNSRSSPNTVRQILTGPETPPTLSKAKFRDHGKSKPKSTKRMFRVQGPTRLRNIIGEC
jgi:hypothetical protein